MTIETLINPLSDWKSKLRTLKLYNVSFHRNTWKTHYLSTQQFIPKPLLRIRVKEGKSILHKYHIKNTHTGIGGVAQV